MKIKQITYNLFLLNLKDKYITINIDGKYIRYMSNGYYYIFFFDDIINGKISDTNIYKTKDLKEFSENLDLYRLILEKFNKYKTLL